MISTYSTSFAIPSRKFVPYIPQAPKPRSEIKAQLTSKAKAARPSHSETSSSQANEPWSHIDDILMPDASASHESAVLRSADASGLSDQGVVDSLETAPFQVVSEHHQTGWDLLGEGGSDQITGSIDGSSRELSLPFVGDTAQVEPRGMATEYQENDRCTAASDKPKSAEQRGYLNVNGVHTLAEDICQASPLAQDKPLLDVVSVIGGLPTTRKRMCPSSVDTVVGPPALLPSVTSELKLEDHRLAKRRRPVARQVEDTMLDPLPTPEVTPRPTSSGLDSYPIISDEPSPRVLDTSNQLGITRSPAPFLSNGDDKNSDDGTHANGTVEVLLRSPEHSATSLERLGGKEFREISHKEARESREDDQVEAVSSRSSAETSQQIQHSNRSARKKRRALFRCGRRRRSESIATTRTSRDATSSQCNPSSKPRITSADRCSTPILSPKARISGKVTGDCGTSADMACRITDIAHYDVPEGSSIITATVHCNESNLAFDTLSLYHTLFGDRGKALRMTQLSPHSWMLLGYRYDAGTSRAHTHESLTTFNTHPMSNSHYDSDQSDEGDDGHEEDDDDEAYRPHAANNEHGYDSSKTRCYQYTHKSWLRSDEERLLSYKDKMAMEWKDIFKLFPDRSPGAVRTRWHMLRGRQDVAAAT